MKTGTKILLGGIAVVLVAGGAVAAEGMRRFGDRERFGQRMFSAVDADKDGAVSLDEMKTALTGRFDAADADKDGSLEKAEIVAAIDAAPELERARRFSGRFADGLVYRVDLDGNGAVAKSEIENRAAKHFALADWNDDGKVEMAEIRRMHMGRGGWRHAGMRWHRGPGWWSRGDRPGDGPGDGPEEAEGGSD